MAKDRVLHRKASAISRDGAEQGGEADEGVEHGQIMTVSRR